MISELELEGYVGVDMTGGKKMCTCAEIKGWGREGAFRGVQALPCGQYIVLWMREVSG